MLFTTSLIQMKQKRTKKKENERISTAGSARPGAMNES